jgi:Tfp pilus assembly protein PilN
MLSLNLIADEAKTTIRFQRLYFLFLKVEVVLFFLALFVVGVIFAAQEILSANIYKTSQETAAMINSSSADYNAKTKEINNTITAVKQVEDGYVIYSKIFASISSLIPSNTPLSYLNINSDQKTIIIRGSAPTRDDLLELEKNLQSAPWLSNVNVPLEEKLNKTNINYDISLSFNQSLISPQ